MASSRKITSDFKAVVWSMEQSGQVGKEHQVDILNMIDGEVERELVKLKYGTIKDACDKMGVTGKDLKKIFTDFQKTLYVA